MAKKVYNKKSISPDKQVGAMKALFPKFKYQKKGSSIFFTGNLVIKPELPVYNVTVEYRREKRPLVSVNSPALVDRAPHTFEGNYLCLYHSENFKWNANRPIAKEIMQWTIAWIYFYEYWLQTGEWIGPEVPHKNEKKDEQKDSV